MCYGGWFPGRSITLSPSVVAGGWAACWISSVWEAGLLPALSAAYAAAGRGDLEGVIRADLLLDARLEGGARAASAMAGEELCGRYSRVYGDKFWRKYLRASDEGRTPCHLATCTAVRAVGFSLSPWQTKSVLLSAEARGAGFRAGSEDFVRFLSDLLPVGGEWMPGVRVA